MDRVPIVKAFSALGDWCSKSFSAATKKPFALEQNKWFAWLKTLHQSLITFSALARY
jgi:hypothetical protein